MYIAGKRLAFCWVSLFLSFLFCFTSLALLKSIQEKLCIYVENAKCSIGKKLIEFYICVARIIVLIGFKLIKFLQKHFGLFEAISK